MDAGIKVRHLKFKNEAVSIITAISIARLRKFMSSLRSYEGTASKARPVCLNGERNRIEHETDQKLPTGVLRIALMFK